MTPALSDSGAALGERLQAWLAARGEHGSLRETHVSVLAFTDDRVYKAKKPVRFAFVDLSTVELRRADCEREVRLNRRLAPDVYRGVVEVPDPTGGAPEPAVEMLRLPDARRLSTLVTAGEEAGPCLDALAEEVVRFHADAARSAAADRAGGYDGVCDLWEQAFTQTAPHVGTVLEPTVAARVETLVRRYLAGRRPLFDARVAAGRVVDGHGDLLAEDTFCLPDGPRVLDCLEFDERFRFGDALADVAFMLMDLERRGRADLGARFAAAYRARSGDRWPSSLEDHYVAYRAHVRAKVACLRHVDGDAAARDHATADLALAHRRLEHGRVRLVLVGGAPGTGKTTLASALARDTGFTLLRTDVVRKERAGLDAAAPAGSPLDTGVYDPVATAATYRELLERAGTHLVSGESVVLDASWGRAQHRRAAAVLAGRTASDVVTLRCVAPVEIARARVADRARRGPDASDATPEIASALAGRFEPWTDAIEIDTTGPTSAASAAARAACGVGASPSRP